MKDRTWGLWAGAVAMLGVLSAAPPAMATHFRYGNLTWAFKSGRTVDFSLQDAFRRTATPSFDPCVDPSNTNTVIACCSNPILCPTPGPKFCANGGSVGTPCTTNAQCGSGNICSPLHGVGDVIREDIGGSQLQFGDGTHTPAGSAPLVYIVTSIDLVNEWSFVQALDPTSLPAIDTTISHTYGGTATTFTAKLDDCCRISPAVPPNGHINNPDKSYTLSTAVTFTGDNAPVSTEVPIVDCCYPALCKFQVPAADPDGDTLRFRLAGSHAWAVTTWARHAPRTRLVPAVAPAPPGREADSGTQQSPASAVFVQPGPPNAPNAASINSVTGLYTWDTTGATLAGAGLNTLYSTQVVVEQLDAGGNVKSRTPVDFLIQLQAS